MLEAFRNAARAPRMALSRADGKLVSDSDSMLSVLGRCATIWRPSSRGATVFGDMMGKTGEAGDGSWAEAGFDWS